MTRKEAWPLYRTISGVRLCWVLEETKGPKGSGDDPAPSMQKEEEGGFFIDNFLV